MTNHARAMLDAVREPEPWNPPDTGPAPVPPPPTPAQRARAAALAASRLVDVQDAQVLTGLALTGYGCYLLHPAAGFIVPGAVLLWWALPTRPRFVEPRPPDVRVVMPDSYQKESKHGPAR